MDSQEHLNVKSTCASILTEACLTAKSLYNQEKEIARYEKSKSEVKRKNLKFDQCPQVPAMNGRSEDAVNIIESQIQDLRGTAADIKTRLNNLDGKLIKEVTTRLVAAANVDSKLDKSVLPIESIDRDALFDIKPYLEQINNMNGEIEKIGSTKLDVTQNAQAIQDLIKQTEELLKSHIQQSKADINMEIQKSIVDVEKLEKRLMHSASEENMTCLVEQVKRKLLGQPSLTEEEKQKQDISELVQKTFLDYLGERLVHQILTEKHIPIIYPQIADNNIQSLQVRDTSANSARVRNQEVGQKRKIRNSLYKIVKMRKESDEALLLCEANLNSRPVQRLLDNIQYIDHITKNHREVLEFINVPSSNINSTPQEDDAQNIPPQISLYTEDIRLSTALVTSITKYTDKLYFSDLTQRVEDLEKRLQ